MQELRVLPSDLPQDSKVSHTTFAHEEYKVHDTFRHGLRQVDQELAPRQLPLYNSLQKFDETRDALKMEMNKRVFGKHVQIRHQMDKSYLSFISQRQRLPCLPRSQLGLQILLGKDELLDMDEIFSFEGKSFGLDDVHGKAEVERLGFCKAL